MRKRQREPRPPPQPRVPHTLLELGQDGDAATRRRLVPVDWVVKHFKRDTTRLAGRKTKCLKRRIVARLEDAPEAVYIDLHHLFGETASATVQEADLELLDEMVPQIAVKSRGQRIADTFSVNAVDVVAATLGEAVWRPKDKTADMLAAPVDFDFVAAPTREIVMRCAWVRLDASLFLDGNASTPTWTYPHGAPPKDEASEARTCGAPVRRARHPRRDGRVSRPRRSEPAAMPAGVAVQLQVLAHAAPTLAAQRPPKPQWGSKTAGKAKEATQPAAVPERKLKRDRGFAATERALEAKDAQLSLPA